MKDILFVDDDRDLLDSVRAHLYKHRHDWNMKFVLSGDEAIAALESSTSTWLSPMCACREWTGGSCLRS